jgi:hypothetical protein
MRQMAMGWAVDSSKDFVSEAAVRAFHDCIVIKKILHKRYHNVCTSDIEIPAKVISTYYAYVNTRKAQPWMQSLELNIAPGSSMHRLRAACLISAEY